MKTVLFACVHNAGRSQMAAAWFNQLADLRQVRAISAGTRPATHVHPAVVTAMNEVGIDLSRAQPQLLTQELARDAALLVTMGCGDECPYVPGLERIDWPLTDPAGKPIEVVREIREAVRSLVTELLTNRGWLTA